MSPRNAELNRRLREDSQRRILAGSLAAFSEHGYAGASIDEIALRAGVSKGLVYNHFPSKEALLAAALDQRFEHLVDVADSLDQNLPPRERLAALVDALVQHVATDPATFRLYLSLTLYDTGAFEAQRATESAQKSISHYLSGIHNLLAELGSRQPVLDAAVLRCALLGLGMRIARREEGLDVDAMCKRILDLLVPGARQGSTEETR